MESGNSKKYIWMAGTIALLSIAFGSFAFGLESLSAVKHPNGQVASITVTGEGEVTAKPDVASVYFTVHETAKTTSQAQKAAEAKVAAALKELKVLGVEEKDIKTTSYNVSIQYETPTPCVTYICPPTTTKISGYQVNQSITVKVRKIDQTGEVFDLLGKANITEMSGPDFTVDDMDKAQADAKELAIEEAKEKAEATAKSLGASLGAIASFSDDQGGYYPTMYRAEAMSVGGAMDAVSKVSLPQGENVIKSRVTITYILK